MLLLHQCVFYFWSEHVTTALCLVLGGHCYCCYCCCCCCCCCCYWHHHYHQDWTVSVDPVSPDRFPHVYWSLTVVFIDLNIPLLTSCLRVVLQGSAWSCRCGRVSADIEACVRGERSWWRRWPPSTTTWSCSSSTAAATTRSTTAGTTTGTMRTARPASSNAPASRRSQVGAPPP